MGHIFFSSSCFGVSKFLLLHTVCDLHISLWWRFSVAFVCDVRPQTSRTDSHTRSSWPGEISSSTVVVFSAVHSAQTGAGERRRSPSRSPDLHRHQRARPEIRPYFRRPHQVPRGRRPDPLVGAALTCCLPPGPECDPVCVWSAGTV